MAKEYIDREAAYSKVCPGCWFAGPEPGQCCKSEVCERLHFALITEPDADVVEVVRCKDCQYWKDGICGFFSNYGITGFIKAAEYITQPDGFCSWAMARPVPAVEE